MLSGFTFNIYQYHTCGASVQHAMAHFCALECLRMVQVSHPTWDRLTCSCSCGSNGWAQDGDSAAAADCGQQCCMWSKLAVAKTTTQSSDTCWVKAKGIGIGEAKQDDQMDGQLNARRAEETLCNGRSFCSRCE